MNYHDFNERLKFSHGVGVAEAIEQQLLLVIPGATDVRPATRAEDRNGTDLWVDRTNGHPLSVDFKHRDLCPIAKWGSDDVCIETCSVFRNGKRLKPGWTVDESKRTDYVVYTWPAADGKRRYWIVPFPILCAASRENYWAWIGKHGEKEAANNGYVTLCVYPTRNEVARAMRDVCRGAA